MRVGATLSTVVHFHKPAGQRGIHPRALAGQEVQVELRINTGNSLLRCTRKRFFVKSARTSLVSNWGGVGGTLSFLSEGWSAVDEGHRSRVVPSANNGQENKMRAIVFSYSAQSY